MTATQIEKALDDMPEASVPGRSGEVTGARVCSAHVTLSRFACAVKVHFAPPNSALGEVEPLPTPESTGKVETRKSLRERLSFITDLPKAEKEKWMDRYKCMPDYYNDGARNTGPDKLEKHQGTHTLIQRSCVCEG